MSVPDVFALFQWRNPQSVPCMHVPPVHEYLYWWRDTKRVSRMHVSDPHLHEDLSSWPVSQFIVMHLPLAASRAEGG